MLGRVEVLASHFGFRPLDRVIEELQAKYGMPYDDVYRLVDAINRYVDFLNECDELLEADEI